MVTLGLWQLTPSAGVAVLHTFTHADITKLQVERGVALTDVVRELHP